MPYISHSPEDIKAMLAEIGLKDLEDLWSSIPDHIRLKSRLELPDPVSDLELEKELGAMAGQNKDLSNSLCFLGGGYYHHYLPRVIDYLVSKGEFATAYTPYQPEISQGTLQAMFEFQTMICELTGMEVANASMYDGASATAEAVLMAARIRPKNDSGPILVSRALHPHYRRVIETYLRHSGRQIITLEYTGSGFTDLEQVKEKSRGALCIVAGQPNYFGALEPLQEIQSLIDPQQTAFIVVVPEALSLGLLKPPGEFAADIVCGEGMSLGIPPGFGGPGLGFFAARQRDVRRMPGRIAGETKDKEGRTGFVLTLATREQHIRRARATSNICTNQGLMALCATIYLSLLGKNGFTRLARLNLSKAEYLKKGLKASGSVDLPFSAPTFNEFIVDLGTDPEPILARLSEQGILAGVPLAHHYPELDRHILVTATEMVSKDDMDQYVDKLVSACRGA
jgi:glycine dehydrogenase subunit 1